MIETTLPLRLESLFARVENHCVLQVLVARLVERSRSFEALALLTVLARPRDVELQTLSVVSLVEMEPGRGGIEANLLANHLLVVGSSCLFLPFSVRVAGLANAGDLVFDAERLLILHDHFSVFRLGNNLLPRVAVAGE